ncbi:carbonic anhydrase [Streptomyces sp. NPDC001966]
MRTGGEAVGPVVTGSVEYGPMTSGTPLIVVLGHQRCGAVTAAYKAIRDGKPLPGNLDAIARALRPAYEQAVREGRLRSGRDHGPRAGRVDDGRPALQPGPGPARGQGHPCRGRRLLLARHGQVEVLAGAPTKPQNLGKSARTRRRST